MLIEKVNVPLSLRLQQTFAWVSYLQAYTVLSLAHYLWGRILQLMCHGRLQ